MVGAEKCSQQSRLSPLHLHCHPTYFNNSAESEWSGLVNAMSGLLCTHLNAIGAKSTYKPLYSFKPQGVVLGKVGGIGSAYLVYIRMLNAGNLSSSQMRYAAVPRETVCTENFTPWTKLLPCGISVCISSCMYQC